MIALRFRVVAAALLGPSLSQAQVPAAVQPPPTARLAGVAGAGAGWMGQPEARSVNPALLASCARFFVNVGYSETEVTDLIANHLGFAGCSRRWGAVSLDGREQHFEDLIEDAEIPPDGLAVSDRGARLGYARAFLGDRLQLGLAIDVAGSTVFSTEGRGWNASLGAAVRPVSRLSFGAALMHLGPPYNWEMSTGETLDSPLGRTVTVGAVWVPVHASWLDVSVLLDRQLGLEQAATHATRFGVEASVAGVLAIRGGLAMVRERGQPWTRTAAAGFGVTLKGIRFDLARDGIGGELGERTLIELVVQR